MSSRQDVVAADDELRQALVELPFEVYFLRYDLALDGVFSSLIDPFVGVEYEPPFLLVPPPLEVGEEYRPEPRNGQHTLVRDVGGSFNAVGLEGDLLGGPDTLDARVRNPAAVQVRLELQPVSVRL